MNETALVDLIGKAASGDAEALSTLLRRYQNLVYGYSLSLLRDRHLAEDVTQETLLAAVVGLRDLKVPQAFLGWLRGIARHHCHRILRRRRTKTLPLESALHRPSAAPTPDVVAERADLVDRILAEINRLPRHLRRAVTLYYIQDSSQEEIAAFLGVSVHTINNWVHAARAKLRAQALTLIEETVKVTALGPEFAARVGCVVRVLGPIADVRFESTTLPRILDALMLADERRIMQVVAVPGAHGDVVRCIVTSPSQRVQPGTRVFDTKTTSHRALAKKTRRRAIRALGRHGQRARRRSCASSEVVETGIKVIDLLSPLSKGGRLGISGDPGAGKLVLIQELVHRLAMTAGGAALFGFVVGREIDFTRIVTARTLATTSPGLETFYLLSGDQERLDPSTREQLDAHILVSREVARQGIYPAVDACASWSRLLDAAGPGAGHREIATRVRSALQELSRFQQGPAPVVERDFDPPLEIARAAKLALFLSQPFYVAAAHTGSPGSWVPLADTVSGCRSILQGEADDMPVEAFRFTGTISEARARLQARPSSDAP